MCCCLVSAYLIPCALVLLVSSSYLVPFIYPPQNTNSMAVACLPASCLHSVGLHCGGTNPKAVACLSASCLCSVGLHCGGISHRSTRRGTTCSSGRWPGGCLRSGDSPSEPSRSSWSVLTHTVLTEGQDGILFCFSQKRTASPRCPLGSLFSKVLHLAAVHVFSPRVLDRKFYSVY